MSISNPRFHRQKHQNDGESLRLDFCPRPATGIHVSLPDRYAGRFSIGSGDSARLSIDTTLHDFSLCGTLIELHNEYSICLAHTTDSKHKKTPLFRFSYNGNIHQVPAELVLGRNTTLFPSKVRVSIIFSKKIIMVMINSVKCLEIQRDVSNRRNSVEEAPEFTIAEGAIGKLDSLTLIKNEELILSVANHNGEFSLSAPEPNRSSEQCKQMTLFVACLALLLMAFAFYVFRNSNYPILGRLERSERLFNRLLLEMILKLTGKDKNESVSRLVVTKMNNIDSIIKKIYEQINK